jgi:adenylylsulfate kinase
MKCWAVWLTGLPGSGKTSRAKELMKKLKQEKIHAEHLEMDEIREVLTPETKYTEEERDYAYRAIVLVSKLLTENRINVIIDATGHRRKWRELAREFIPNFIEVYIKSPLKVSMKRESRRDDDKVLSDLYKKALKRKEKGKDIEGLGQMIGIDVEYEEPENPDLIIESDKLNPRESSEKIFQLLKNKKWK